MSNNGELRTPSEFKALCIMLISILESEYGRVSLNCSKLTSASASMNKIPSPVHSTKSFLPGPSLNLPAKG